MAAMAMAARSVQQLPAECGRRLAGFLRQVDSTDLVWLEEICEEAFRMFVSDYREELELMPKTPSQKNRQRRRRRSALHEEGQETARKRLSRRRKSSLKPLPSVRCSQRLQDKQNLELSRAEAKGNSPPQRVTRSQATASLRSSKVVSETPPALQAVGKDPWVVADQTGTAVPLQRSTAKPAELLPTSSGDGSPEERGIPKSLPVPTAPELVVPSTPEASEAVSELQVKAANVTINLSPRVGLEEGNGPTWEHDQAEEPSQPLRDNPGTPTGSRRSRRSVRRSLMGKTSLSCRTSLAEKYSLASKRESMVRKSITRAASKRKMALQGSMSSSSVEVSSSTDIPEEEETVVKAGPPPGPCTPSKDSQSPQMSLSFHTISKQGQPQEPSNKNKLNKSGETLDPPQSARRKPSYKRAVDERYDQQQAEEGGLSPPRKKTPSPVFPASKVVRPFKTFLHTVQKNQLLMTPSSVGRNGVIKSFIRYNTPLQADSKEKERQKLEALQKKQEAEQLRRQRLEEEKKRRLEEAKLKREERLRKVLQARERAEEMEKARKRKIEQKIALFDEKTEKVREERLAEEKIKKRAAARKMEEAEARRRQEEEARRQKALQQEEEEERRHRELLQKRREEEQERARKIAEQRQAEQERERQLAADRELERKREQERIQAEKLREQQERAARLQKEVQAAKERLRKEMEKKEREQQMLAERKRQEEEQKKLSEEQKAKDSARAPLLENKENSPACTSYQMTPQSRKEPKPAITSSNDYGMDLNSDDSTDDESEPRKPVPAWATGNQLSQAVIRQYYNPPDVDALFGAIPSPKLEDIFYKSKPRYFKRTSSAVWHSPPTAGAKPGLGLPCGLKKP
ncbi:PREDICTED: inner centromere protein isoform X2 [Lepidothrix coronata]|uniref:Inner centromere protein isoform X2 n=1 Tax=Lepidothrix coronata TaxID=321398 RepID=A0A6J0J473_9PASS|nr:PREDICTED: inner centromere protein isoform X2 [Lepidothrix coronata]